MTVLKIHHFTLFAPPVAPAICLWERRSRPDSIFRFWSTLFGSIEFLILNLTRNKIHPQIIGPAAPKGLRWVARLTSRNTKTDRLTHIIPWHPSGKVIRPLFPRNWFWVSFTSSFEQVVPFSDITSDHSFADLSHYLIRTFWKLPTKIPYPTFWQFSRLCKRDMCCLVPWLMIPKPTTDTSIERPPALSFGQFG